MQRRRWLTVTFALAALLCEAFAWWGLNTVSGRAQFDEMAGMIPVAAAALGVCFAGAALVFAWLQFRRASAN